MMKLSKLFKTRYRIVEDNYAGFEVQYRKWYVPFYLFFGGINTHPSFEKAREYLKQTKVKEANKKPKRQLHVLWEE